MGDLVGVKVPFGGSADRAMPGSVAIVAEQVTLLPGPAG